MVRSPGRGLKRVLSALRLVILIVGSCADEHIAVQRRTDGKSEAGYLPTPQVATSFLQGPRGFRTRVGGEKE